MIEYGFHQKFKEWTKEYMKSVWKINRDKTEERHALSLTQLVGGILLYMIGMAVGILAFIVEICFSRM